VSTVFRCHWSISFPTPWYGRSGDGERASSAVAVALREGGRPAALLLPIVSTDLYDVRRARGATISGSRCGVPVRGRPVGETRGGRLAPFDGSPSPADKGSPVGLPLIGPADDELEVL
jgi:hypothetical protein